MTREQHLLIILMEECAEIAQVASKALRFGLDHAPEGREESNAELIAREFTDLQGVYDMLWRQGALRGILDAQVIAKTERIEHFLNYSATCGTLEA